MDPKTLSMRLTGALLLAAVSVGCSPDASVDCGDGELVEYSDASYCVFRGNIIETRFTCPLDSQIRHDLPERDVVVCGPSETLPGGFGEHIGEQGWQVVDPDPMLPEDPVDPIEPADPSDPTDPNEPTDPVDPSDPVDPPEEPVDPVEPPEEPAPGLPPVVDDPDQLSWLGSYWDFDAVTGAERIATYSFSPTYQMIFEGSTMEDFELGAILDPTTDDRIPIRCSIAGDYTHLDARTLVFDGVCDDGEVRKVSMKMGEVVEDVWPGGTFLVETSILGDIPEGYNDVGFWAPIYAHRCSVEPGPLQCRAFMRQASGGWAQPYSFQTDCSAAFSEQSCEYLASCEPRYDSEGAYESCERIDCAGLEAQTCFDVPHCQGLYQDACDEESLDCDAFAFAECSPILECKMSQAALDYEACTRTGGQWARDEFSEPGACGCPNLPIVRRFFGAHHFVSGLGCVSEQIMCEELQGDWEARGATGHEVRPDISEQDCVGGDEHGFVRFVYDSDAGVCNLYRYDDPNATCTVNGEVNSWPLTDYLEQIGDPSADICGAQFPDTL